MKLVLAAYGTRGDLEPSVAAGRELVRRGHDVRMAVPPDLVGFAESAGLVAVPYGLDTQAWVGVYRDFWTCFFHRFWRVGELSRLWREMWDLSDRSWTQMSTALTSLAEGADLLFAGQSYQEPAANVAEYLDIPFATLHNTPVRVNGQLLSRLPGPLARRAMWAYDWFGWRLNKKVEDAQRRELGLPKATGPVSRRIAARGALEVQAYDEVCFPGLAEEWARWRNERPFVGTLTMELATEADTEVSSWIAEGTPPICFGFGSMPVESPAATVEMIASACAELGQRALVCSGWSDYSEVPRYDHVKVVGAVNYATVFPACRAAVHHGGAGTLAASLRAGVPTLVLWIDGVQPVWASRVKLLNVGAVRSFSSTTQESLVADLGKVLDPECAARARDVAGRMVPAAESVARTADLVECYARQRCSA
ncbi:MULTISPECIES: glycosyltransferase [unclassified Mycolicibacterium]|uniref:glycosyltransferase n=1 Tax=unclassified Mycolicibacterium TaxID=2636767 RepID=UPI0012DC1350|nr:MULTISPECIES: glycosyltransferase [unclassified Mycolicibacterium]MUL82885.1 glycosyltransferase [Mycolicibacterium sp. CBMA 329]MUL89220.1 glycosyltransferase [Mycolicibacterium sp. CBMA 331]MUL97787.1 glycosyltransferase [Mycolicibacterium sp. CBMA 334]MUM25302.1 glycosyltransferase [Mycolicibacterium sp. CBMA 295]MUM38736.1 glycosyltransferase [Mycolicibacterium sp. CBMA 247]